MLADWQVQGRPSPLKLMLHIEFPLISTKCINFLLISAKFVNFPLFSFNLRVFLPNLRFVVAPLYFDHDAFMHHTIDIGYWTPLDRQSGRQADRQTYHLVCIWDSIRFISAVIVIESWMPKHFISEGLLDLNKSSIQTGLLSSLHIIFI